LLPISYIITSLFSQHGISAYEQYFSPISVLYNTHAFSIIMAEETKTTDGSAQMGCDTTELAITRIRRKIALVLNY